MANSDRVIGAIGEIALRVTDLDRMQRFYTEVIGLDLLRRFPNIAFFRIAEGFAGHTQILALFDRSHDRDYSGVNATLSTVDHLAFAIALANFESERRRLVSLGFDVSTTTHGWVKWRSLYLQDPEGNQVELVCYDESIIDEGTDG